MAQTRKQFDSPGVPRATHGYLSGTYTAADTIVSIGFNPGYIKVVNATTRLMLEWHEGLAASNYIKTVAAGTRTLETDGALLPNGDNTFTITLAGGGMADNDTTVWEAR